MKLKVLNSGSKGNCYLLANEKDIVILECGIKYKEILKGINFDLSKVRFVLISHSHLDHSKAAAELLKAGIDVYMSNDTAKELGLEGYRLKIIEPLKQFGIGEFTILPFKLQHDVTNLGYLIYVDNKKILFMTDTFYCQYKFSGINHLIIECNYSKEILQKNIENGLNPIMAQRLLRSHFSLENLKEFLKVTDLSKCKDITLIHLSDGNSNAKQFKTEIERLTGIPTFIADVGLEIEL